MPLDHVIYRLVSDESFRTQLVEEPRAILAGLTPCLDAEDLEAVTNIPWAKLISDLGKEGAIARTRARGWWACQLDHCPTQLEMSITG